MLVPVLIPVLAILNPVLILLVLVKTRSTFSRFKAEPSNNIECYVNEELHACIWSMNILPCFEPALLPIVHTALKIGPFSLPSQLLSHLHYYLHSYFSHPVLDAYSKPH